MNTLREPGRERRIQRKKSPAVRKQQGKIDLSYIGGPVRVLPLTGMSMKKLCDFK